MDTQAIWLASDVRRQCGPPPGELVDLEEWLDRELGVALVLHEPRLCVPGCRGFARIRERDGTRGGILLPAGTPHLAFRALHELGHLLLGTDGFDLDAPRWRMVPEERAADTFAVCCLIDGPTLIELRLMDMTMDR